MISLRRAYINKYLLENSKYIKNEILDIGGSKKDEIFYKKINKKIIYSSINIDSKKKPNYLENFLLFKNYKKKFDVILCIETLEYIDDVDLFFNNALRILKKKGLMIFTIPFLHAVHSDQEDLVRYTRKGINNLIKDKKIKKKKLIEIGGMGSVIYDIIRVSIGYGGKNNKFLKLILILTRPLFLLLDFFSKSKNKYINTGYFFILQKI